MDTKITVNKEEMEEYIKIFSDIILSLGDLQFKKINKEQKIKFVSLAYMTGVYDYMEDVYIYIQYNKNSYEDKGKIYRVLHFLSHFCLQNMNNNDISFPYKTKCIKRVRNYAANYGVKWLNMYDIEKEFKPNATDMTRSFSFVNEDGEIVSIDKNLASDILNILESAGIPIFHCIVKEAFKAYANENLNEFIMEYETKYLSDMPYFGKKKVKVQK